MTASEIADPALFRRGKKAIERKTIEAYHFHLLSLGCPKNRVDTEQILAGMIRAGFVYTDDPSSAEVIIVNSCAFIQAAVEESIDVILDLRAENDSAFLVVAGCLPLRYGEPLGESMPEVDLFVRPDAIPELPECVIAGLERPQGPAPAANRPGATRDSGVAAHPSADGGCVSRPAMRTLSTPGYAYLRIAEGCARKCRYCTIPAIRGPLRSVAIDRLEDEARFLASQGARELILVAQDLTSYGLDLHEKSGLIRLLQRLDGLGGIEWIRLMYLFPDAVPRELGTIMNESSKILPYLDIPFQHVSPNVLRSMGRPWKGSRIERLVERLRAEIDGLVLRTTFMVGYPTEEDEDFRTLEEFVETAEIEHVGVFTYSPEEGTDALALGDPIPPDVKDERATRIAEIHASHTEDRNRRRIGAIEKSIVEGVSQETDLLLQGRLWDQAPEVDGVLYVTAGSAAGREIRSVRITDCHGPDLFGELID